MFELLITNDYRDRRIFFEPWGEELRVASGETMLIQWTGSSDGQTPSMEVTPDLIVIHGLPGCGLKAFCDGELAWESYEDLP